MLPEHHSLVSRCITKQAQPCARDRHTTSCNCCTLDNMHAALLLWRLCWQGTLRDIALPARQLLITNDTAQHTPILGDGPNGVNDSLCTSLLL